jgi:hypothetical protein
MIKAGPVATTANTKSNKTGLKLLAASPTKVANKPADEYKNLCALYEHIFISRQIFQ